jgi:hypothetical protein
MATLDEKDIESVAGEGNSCLPVLIKIQDCSYGQLDAFESI